MQRERKLLTNTQKTLQKSAFSKREREKILLSEKFRVKRRKEEEDIFEKIKVSTEKATIGRFFAVFLVSSSSHWLVTKRDLIHHHRRHKQLQLV